MTKKVIEKRTKKHSKRLKHMTNQVISLFSHEKNQVEYYFPANFLLRVI